MLQIVPRRTDRMPQRIQRHRRATLHWPAHPQQEQKETEKSSYKKAYDTVPQSWIINCLQMYKISDEIINFIKKTIKTWRVELIARGESLAETKIQRGIFQGDALSPLLLLIAMMPLNHVLRKCTTGYKLSKSQERSTTINQTVRKKKKKKNEKKLETLIHAVRIYSQDVGMEFGIEQCTMLVIKSGKQHLTKLNN